jgi:PAS domain S-box-containing protein
MNNLPGMAYRCLNNKNWTMKFLSSGCDRLTGYPKEELLNDKSLTFNDIILPEDRDYVAKSIQKQLDKNQPYQLEYRIKTKDGQQKWVWEQGRAIQINGADYLEGLILDITERKKAEQQLKKSEKRYRALFNSSHDAIMTLEPPDWKFTSTNPTLLDMFKIKKEDDFIGLRPEDISPEQQPGGEKSSQKAKRMLKKAMDKGVNFFEWQHKRFDGEEFPATVLLNRVQLEDKAFLQATIRDITERKKAEEALKKSEQKYHSLIQQSNDAIYLLYDNKFEIINQKFEELFGITQKEANSPDFNFMELVAPKSRAVVKQRMKALSSGEEPPSRYEFTALDKDKNELEVEVSVSYISYKNGIATQGILRDITERKKMQQQLQQSQKLESIGNLAAGVAHDFNNILTVIQGNAQMAEGEVEQNSPLNNYLHNIIDSSKRAASLTEQLLLFSRKQAMDFGPLNLNSSIRDILKMLDRLIGEHIKIKTNLADNLWTIKADKNNIEQVIMNTAINAQDAMPEGGTLTISTENMTIPAPGQQQKEHSEEGEYVRLIIEDTGIGIDEKNIDKIFDPFFTTKGMAKGTGMGLSVVYGIIKKHRGWINVESEPGQGTKFLIDFPAIDGETSDEEEKKIHIDQLSGDGESILFIEDNPDVIKVGRIILQDNGYNVESATNASEALEKFKNKKDQYNLIISDVVLPDKTGLELVELIKNIKNDIPVILCSGYTDEQSKRQEIYERGYKFIQKPFNIEEMLRAIKSSLSKN